MLSRWQSTIVDAQGNVQPYAELTIRNEFDQSLAEIYRTPDPVQPYPLGQVVADETGYAYFYAAGGLYRITSQQLGIDWRHVPLGELASMDIDGLDLGTAASKDVMSNSQDRSAGRLLYFGAWGLTNLAVWADGSWDNYTLPGVYMGTGLINAPWSGWAYAHNYRHNVLYTTQVSYSVTALSPRHAIRSRVDGVWRPWVETKTTANTTIDSNGFLKNASPVIRVFADKIETNDHPDTEKAVLECIGTGHYVINNTTGLASEGWYIETPKDANGNVKVFVEYADNDGTITIKTFEPIYPTGRAEAGEPADIPEGRWIDVRLNETELPAIELPLAEGGQSEPGQPYYITQFSVLDFRDRFTLDEQIAIRQAQLTDMEVGLVYDAFISAQFIDVTDPRVEQGIDLYIAKELLEPDRKAALLEPALIPPPATD